MKRKICFFAAALTAVIAAVACLDFYISFSAGPFLHSSVENLPYNKCGLLLGTSKYRVEGGINPYFANRLDAAALLYHKKKISFIIASGDNSEKNYNEPRLMLQGLRRRGVPADKIYADYAGFRTLDSVVRAREIFGQNSVTVISQKFHNERAVYIGRHFGINISGYCAGDVTEPASIIKVRFRETLARLKAFIDLHITGQMPKFLGEKIKID